MGIRIELYKNVGQGRELHYIPLTKEFLDSEELADELTWSSDLSGKGDESGVFGFVSYETLKEIVNKSEVINDIAVEEFEDLCKAIAQTKEDFGCYVGIYN